MSYEINDLLHLMVDEGASDLHIHVGQPPCLRILRQHDAGRGRAAHARKTPSS